MGKVTIVITRIEGLITILSKAAFLFSPSQEPVQITRRSRHGKQELSRI